MLPSSIISPLFGGPLADAYDKRLNMIYLDVLSSLCVLFLFPLAASLRSPALLYSSVFLLSSLEALYSPSKNSILPFMLNSDDEVNKATSLLAISWSLMSAVGAATGGAITKGGGTYTCFVVDGVTFAVSAVLMWMVGDGWKVARENNAQNPERPPVKAEEKEEPGCMEAMSGGVRYLSSSSGSRLQPLVFLKSAGCILWGSSDVLNVVFAAGDEFDLGCIFAAVGVGCLVGPQAAERFIKGRAPGEPDPRLMVWACGLSVLLVSVR
jgi:MFS family permease